MAFKNTPEGELMRLLEFKVEYTDAEVITVAEGKHLFDHVLDDNYGTAGELYIRWLVGNLEEAVSTMLRVQKKIDQELRLSQRERNYSAIVAANITGGLIAKQLGLIDWDIKRIFNVVAPKILDLGADAVASANSASSVIGDYIYRHNHNILVVEDGVDNRSQMQKLPVLEPRGALLIRYEPDTKRLFFSVREFKKDCVENQVNYKDILKELETNGVLLEVTTKRLAKGSKIVAPGVRALVFDCSNPDFINMDHVAPPPKSDEG
jgi:hypothetical protein